MFQQDGVLLEQSNCCFVKAVRYTREYVILYILLGNINDDASPICLTSA